jgi:hypothetical protein
MKRRSCGIYARLYPLIHSPRRTLFRGFFRFMNPYSGTPQKARIARRYKASKPPQNQLKAAFSTSLSTGVESLVVTQFDGGRLVYQTNKSGGSGLTGVGRLSTKQNRTCSASALDLIKNSYMSDRRRGRDSDPRGRLFRATPLEPKSSALNRSATSPRKGRDPTPEVGRDRALPGKPEARVGRLARASLVFPSRHCASLAVNASLTLPYF